MVCLEIPEDSIADISIEQLPDNWFENPPPDSIKQKGDLFIKNKKHLALKVPSAVMPEEYNLLLNPAHPNFNKVKILYSRTLRLDERLLKR